MSADRILKSFGSWILVLLAILLLGPYFGLNIFEMLLQPKANIHGAEEIDLAPEQIRPNIPVVKVSPASTPKSTTANVTGSGQTLADIEELLK